jgi:hypothetical protein
MKHETRQIIDDIFKVPARRESVKWDLDTVLETEGPDIAGIIVQPGMKLIRVGHTYVQILIDENGNHIKRKPIGEDEAIRLYAASILGSLES